jgi:hypothetical protein
MKIAFDKIGTALSTAKIASDIRNHFLLIMWPMSADGIALDVLSEKLVRVEFRTVRWKIHSTNMIGICLQPSADALCTVYGMIVNDQIHLSLVLSHQALHEIQQHISRKALLEHHKAKLSFIGERGNHIAAKALTSPRNDRSLSTTTKRSSRRMVRAQSHLIPPIHQGMFALCTSVQQRIDLLHPLLDRLWILLECTSSRLLWSKTPLRQPSSNGPNRASYAEALFYISLYRFPCPKVIRQLQLIRAVVFDRTYHLRSLPSLQGTAPGSAFRLGIETNSTLCLIQLHPFVDGVPRDPKDSGRLDMFLPLQHSLHCLPTDLFLSFGRKRASIFCFHARNIRNTLSLCKLFYALISKREIQPEGRIRYWAYIDELQKYLRVVTLADGETVHNAFPDRDFKEEQK